MSVAEASIQQKNQPRLFKGIKNLANAVGIQVEPAIATASVITPDAPSPVAAVATSIDTGVSSVQSQVPVEAPPQSEMAPPAGEPVTVNTEVLNRESTIDTSPVSPAVPGVFQNAFQNEPETHLDPTVSSSDTKPETQTPEAEIENYNPIATDLFNADMATYLTYEDGKLKFKEEDFDTALKQASLKPENIGKVLEGNPDILEKLRARGIKI